MRGPSTELFVIGYCLIKSSVNPAHVDKNPVTVNAMVCGLVGKVGLIVLYPLVGIDQGEMMVNLCQFTNKVRRPQASVTFGVKLNGSVEGGVNV